MKKYNEVDKKINDLLDVTYTIAKVYNELAYYKSIENTNKYQEWLKNLKICIEVEDEIYQEKFKNIEEFSQLSNRINYLNSKREEELEVKKIIIERILSYLELKDYPNPFLSMEEDEIKQIEENVLAIGTQYKIDYNAMFFNLLHQQINKASNRILKENLIYLKYEKNFMNKVTEKSILYNQRLNLLEGKERAIFFNQDKELVQSLYYEASKYLVILQLKQIINLDSKFLESKESIEYSLKKEYLIGIESSLYLLEAEEIKELYNEFLEVSPMLEQNIFNEIQNIFKKYISKNKSKKLIITK